MTTTPNTSVSRDDDRPVDLARTLSVAHASCIQPTPGYLACLGAVVERVDASSADRERGAQRTQTVDALDAGERPAIMGTRSERDRKPSIKEDRLVAAAPCKLKRSASVVRPRVTFGANHKKARHCMRSVQIEIGDEVWMSEISMAQAAVILDEKRGERGKPQAHVWSRVQKWLMGEGLPRDVNALDVFDDSELAAKASSASTSATRRKLA